MMTKLAVTILAAALAGLAGGFLALTLVDEPASLPLDLGIEDRLDGLDNRLEAIEVALEGQRRDESIARSTPPRSLQPELAALRSELDSLRTRLDRPALAPSTERGSATSPGSHDEASLVDLVDERIEAIEKAKAAEKRKRDQERAEAKLLQEATQRVAEYSKRLGLNADQTVRLQASYHEALRVASPLYGTLKDTGARPDDRLAAIQLVRSNRQTFDERSRSILDGQQYEKFVSLRRKEDRGLTRWLEDIEGEIRGTPPSR